MYCLIENFEEFCTNINRAELIFDKHSYLKGVRTALIAVGYNEDFINGVFYDALMEKFKDISLQAE